MKGLHITPAPDIPGDQSDLLDVSLFRSPSSAAIHDDEFEEFIHPNQAQALKHYKIRKIVGLGAFGEVSIAKHLPSGERVAIKIVKDFLKHSMLARSTIREVSILRQLTKLIKGGAYPHVVTLRDVVVFYSGTSDQEVSIALVMECGNQDLNKVIFSEKRAVISHRGFLHTFYSLLCALRFLESAGVVHRDIKPLNVLINNDFSVKLCDFGLARTVPALKDIASPKASGESKGQARGDSPKLKTYKSQQNKRSLSPHVVTRAYRPPEIILMHRDYDTKVDVWSAGATLLEVFNSVFTVLDPTGYNPFSGTYCHPLSPLSKKRETSDRDQLQSILSIMGKQEEEDLQFLHLRSQIEHVRKYESGLGKIDFTIEYSESDPKLMKLFNSMFQFNPHLRSSAADLLESKVFNKVRNPEMEKIAAHRVEVSIDEPGVFDYQTKTTPNMTKNDHLREIIKEISLLKI